MAFSAAVLTGGRSTRMGADKAFVDVGGRPMAAYPLAALRQAGAAEVLAIGGDGARLAGLGFTFVEEPEPGRGPLAGVVLALQASAHELVAIVACDLPLVTAAAISALVDAATSSGADASVAAVAGRLQPVLAVYRRRTVPTLVAALEEDGALHLALSRLQLKEVELDDGSAAFNVNEPSDLEALEALRRRSTWPAGGGR